MGRILNINSFNKKLILARVGRFIWFFLFNFVYFFTNTRAANFEMVLFIAKCTLFVFNKVSCLLIARLWLDLFSLFLKILSISVVGWDIRILLACLRISSAAWPALIALDGVRPHSQRSPSRRELSLVLHAIISLIRESWKLSNSHSELTCFNQSQNHESFDPLGACIWKTCGREWLCFS